VAVEENVSALPRSFGYVVGKEIAYPANLLGEAILNVLYSLLRCFHFIELARHAPGRVGIGSEAVDKDEAVPTSVEEITCLAKVTLTPLHSR
jgi:hypothetical protein